MEKPFKQRHNPERQYLTAASIPGTVDDHLLRSERAEALADGPVASTIKSDSEFDRQLAKLREQLQTALVLEHSTIPPYLCALYSIKAGTNLMASNIIRSVVLEEMLHMIMVANLLNAVGGRPLIGEQEEDTKGRFIPSYPTRLPGNIDQELEIDLSYFSKQSIRTFWKIEHPVDSAKLPPKISEDAAEYPSIGAFYEALQQNLRNLEAYARHHGKTIFTGDVAKQVTSQHYYGAGGMLFQVRTLKDAEDVINEIVGQGEGADNSIFTTPYHRGSESYLLFKDTQEYAHYFRFKEVYYGRFYATTDSAHRNGPNHGLPTGERFEVDWEAVNRMTPNPKMADYPKGSPVYEKMYEFNRVYSALLDSLHVGCNGHPEALKEGIPLMYELKYKATELMNIPLADGYMAGPSFEYIKP